jgi:CheY-like chemotaxis protein
MPVMDGLCAIRQLRLLSSELPVILASGEGPGENVGDDRHLVHISKPFSVEEILGAVLHLLSSSSQKKAG